MFNVLMFFWIIKVKKISITLNLSDPYGLFKIGTKRDGMTLKG